MKTIEDNKIDLLFCDLPWAATSCKWDCALDLKLFWKEINRICKINCPMFFCCNVKFGNTLINSNPKNYRYDLVWIKSSPVGFLNSKKQPMKKHELIYVFYRKLPFYDLSSHKHKFIKNVKTEMNCLYSNKIKRTKELIQYDPPLPTSIIKDIDNKYTPKGGNHYEGLSRLGIITNKPLYDPPLPTSIIKDDLLYTVDNDYRYKCSHTERKHSESIYDPPLPNSILEIKSEKGKHSTQKPVKLIEWILKYYSKEGDTILDPTCGSGSSGVACINMNRQYIGIEKDLDIFNVAKERLKIT
jgi:DNA modification methylase